MLKKSITYTDFNGVERTEDFFFNLTKAEIMELELGVTGGLTAMVQGVVMAQDTPSLIKIFKELILKSYGEKSADGKRFIKINDAGVSLANNFAQTEAYSELFMLLATNEDEASNCIRGIVPSDVSERMDDDEVKKLTTV